MREMSLFLACFACSSARDMRSLPDAASPAFDAAIACEYPAQGFGATPGTIVRPDLSWQGFAPNASTITAIAAKDFFDCDGSKGINAIVFDVSAEWCPACQSEAADMPKLFSQYDALGIKVVTLLIQDAANAPATVETITRWKQKYALTDVFVCADPSFSFQPSAQGSIALPLVLIVDPKTMTIVKSKQGYIAHYPLSPDADAVALAKKNAAN